MREFVKKWEVLITVIISITSIFLATKANEMTFPMNVRVTDKKVAQDDVDVQAAVKKVTEELGDIGRILVRESGTESVVHVMVETESDGFEL